MTSQGALGKALGVERPARLFVAYAFLSFAYASCISLIFMQYVFYDTMLEALQVSNMELGMLLSIEGMGAIVLALPGGMITDRFDCRKVALFSLLATGAAGMLLCSSPNYPTAIFAWAVFAISMCGISPSVFKVVRVMVPEGSTGRSFGIFGMLNAVAFIAMNSLSLYAYDWASSTMSASESFAVICAVFSIVILAMGIAAYAILRGIPLGEAGSSSNTEKVGFASIKRALKLPGTYLAFVVTFTINGFHTTISYFTPYFTTVLGATIIASGAFAIVRQYGLRIIGSPIGGILGDKTHSMGAVMGVMLVICSAVIGVVALLPHAAPLALVVALVVVLALMDNTLVSLKFSIFPDAGIPPELTGTTTGLVTIFLPNLFMPALYGHWLDTMGNDGYANIFLFCIAFNLVGAIAAFVIAARFKRANEGGSEERETGR